MLREQIFSIFGHFRVTGGEMLLGQNFSAVTHIFLKVFSEEEIKTELYNMINDGLIIDDDKGFFLTEKGEIEIYGVFKLNESINEIFNVFKFFGTVPGGLLPIGSLNAKKYEMLSPITNKHLVEVLKECEVREYIEGTSNGYILKKRF